MTGSDIGGTGSSLVRVPAMSRHLSEHEAGQLVQEPFWDLKRLSRTGMAVYVSVPEREEL